MTVSDELLKEAKKIILNFNNIIETNINCIANIPAVTTFVAFPLLRKLKKVQA